MLWGQTLTEIFSRGSYAMWPLFLCSVLGAAVIFERLFFFIRIRFSQKNFHRVFFDLLKKGDMTEAVKYCRKAAHPVPRLAAVYLKNVRNDSMRSDLLKRESAIALKKVEAHLRILSAITHIAPLLGLLGTVTGLVSAFHQIELLGGTVQPSDLAGGIWEALLTTVFGLTIAIPCMAFYHIFETAADNICLQIQVLITDMDEFFTKQTNDENIKQPSSDRKEHLEGIQ